MDVLGNRQEKGVDISLWYKHQKDFFYMIIRCLGIYNSFKMLSKPDTEHITEYKKKCVSLLNELT